MLFERPMVFVDLETTGANAESDRITEIGIVEIDGDTIHEWSTLVNPGVTIPKFIQNLTGISDEMVANAPSFEAVAQETLKRLTGRLFVAHNARFDYGFLRNEFKRLGIKFSATALCTVKLSRKLFPQHHKHNLDAVIQRHNLPIDSRHRALADVKALMFFMRHLNDSLPLESVTEAINSIIQRPALPAHLDPAVLDDLPESCGVYMFYGTNDQLLYINKSSNIRKSIYSFFSKGIRHSNEAALAQQLQQIAHIETVSELGALLTETRLMKEHQHLHTTRTAKRNDLCTWQMEESDNGTLIPKLKYSRDLDFGGIKNLYGLFPNGKVATKALRSLADAHLLCHNLLGLETQPMGKPCKAFHSKNCLGACIGVEPIASHNARLKAALFKSQVQAWPFNGLIGVKEIAPLGARIDIHLIENWCYLGTIANINELDMQSIKHCKASFDIDVYKALSKQIGSGKLDIVYLDKITAN
ncbi:3'-5' exonuclease family protein [Sulfurirhabdus autotrophica]|uniref:DNA-directed DNA polymerase n=1 Tax=Sulfurirhabdus autotrophica TaxID=1706046 RepID=A0A4R3YG97_9PROT|nr:3'-5' exonuclease family protein [Sulfurirhabdus autotrophica]TCV90238.1 DNA polymerase-3 subunit epsilon [Sulfurirhabdus autotrophica]